MSEERFSKIENKQIEHDKVLDRVTYLIERIEETLEKMDSKIDLLHSEWTKNNGLIASYTSMQMVFKETTDELQIEIKKAHEDIDKIREWQAEQKGRGKITLLFWGLASTIFGGFVTAIMVALVLGK
jgi:hypothetical protein